LRNRCREVIWNCSKLFKALAGLLVARDAGAALTGSAPAFVMAVLKPHGR
jgi:hypothetical protein